MTKANNKVPKIVVSTVVAAATITLISLTSCGKVTEPFKDAPRSGYVNENPMDVIQMADGFSNVGTKCDHGNRIYVIFKGDENRGAIAVIPQDPTCQK